jgi:ATP-binding cassette subfamily B protein
MALLAEEEAQERPFALPLLMRLLRYLSPYKKRLALAFCLILTGAVAGQAGPRLTQIAVDRHILHGDLNGLRGVVLLFLVCVVVQYLAEAAQTVVTELTAQYAMRDLRRDVFAHLQRLPMGYFDRTPIGRIMTRTTNDVEALSEFFTDGAVSIFADCFALLAIIAFMVDMDLRLTLVAAAVVPVLVAATWYLQGLAMQAYRQLRLRLARLNSSLQENIAGIEVVQLFGRQQRNQADFGCEHVAYRQAEDREIHCYAIFFPLTEFVVAAGTALVLYFGALAVWQQRLELGVLMAFLQYVRRFFRPIMDLNDRYTLVLGAMASSERIFQLLDVAPESLGGRPQRPPLVAAGLIEFDRVWFRYGGATADYVLRDVSFRLEPGHSLALVGATGSGKSTLVGLLCRLYEIERGAIRIDGRDLRDWNTEELRRNIGVVQQDVFLFSGDIAGNIGLGDPAISAQRLAEAARHVRADRFIARLPEGLAHPVGERGATLSAGERQLLSFARALAYDPRILVLDEATSSIDTETEQLVQDAIASLLSGRTSIVVAHRLSTIRRADQILVLHHGEVRERGRHEDLLRQGGIYQRLHQLNYAATQPPSPPA